MRNEEGDVIVSSNSIMFVYVMLCMHTSSEVKSIIIKYYFIKEI